MDANESSEDESAYGSDECTTTEVSPSDDSPYVRFFSEYFANILTMERDTLEEKPTTTEGASNERQKRSRNLNDETEEDQKRRKKVCQEEVIDCNLAGNLPTGNSTTASFERNDLPLPQPLTSSLQCNQHFCFKCGYAFKSARTFACGHLFCISCCRNMTRDFTAICHICELKPHHHEKSATNVDKTSIYSLEKDELEKIQKDKIKKETKGETRLFKNTKYRQQKVELMQSEDQNLDDEKNKSVEKKTKAKGLDKTEDDSVKIKDIEMDDAIVEITMDSEEEL